MKGFIDKNGFDRPPCRLCKYEKQSVTEAPCYNCISTLDLALLKPNSETEFASFTPKEEA